MSEIPSSIEQDIVKLEQQLQEKRAALEHTESKDTATDRELLKDVIGQQIQNQAPAYTPAPAASAQTSQPSYATPELHDQVQELVDLAFSKNLAEAVAELVKRNNPALIDAFHDVITDQLHQEMVKRKLIDQP
jgi:hypothetical protein